GSKFIIFIIIFFQAEDGIRDRNVTGVQTCALPISRGARNSQFSICFSSRSCASTITVLRTVVVRSDHPDGSAGIRELTAAENIPFGRPAAGSHRHRKVAGLRPVAGTPPRRRPLVFLHHPGGLPHGADPSACLSLTT